MWLGEKPDDVGGHFCADPVNIEQPCKRLARRVLRRLHLAPPIGERAIVAGEQPRRRLADLRNAERIDEPVERNPPPLVDRRDELLGADLAPALAFRDDRGVEPEDVARLANRPALPKGGVVLPPDPPDAKTVAQQEV